MNWLNPVNFFSISTFLRLRHFILLFTVLQAGLVQAQVKFSAIASSKEIGRNDYVQVEYVIENAQQIEQLVQPSFRDFKVVQGPIQSSGMSVVNGAVSQYKSIAFVLQPLKTGRFTIPGSEAVVDGKAMKSNPLTIVVSAGGSGNNNPLPLPQTAWPEPEQLDMDYILKPGENIDEKIRKNLFVRVQVSKTNCYVGEPIVATYKLYSHLQSESSVSRHPSLNGFSVYDMVDPNSAASTVETVNGKPFTVHVIRKAQLIPLQSGRIDLDPLEIENTVHFLKRTKPRHGQGNGSYKDLFDPFSEDGEQGVPVEQHITIQTKPVSISVKALPEENKPEDFNGAVGHFSIQSGLENNNLTVQDAGVLKITVKGDGNLPVVNAPTVDWPAGIESYEASAKEDIDKTLAPLSGTKSFEYSFVPKHAGKYTIPAVSFSYFDPASATYKTIRSLSLAFQAALTKKTRGHAMSPLNESGDGSGTEGRKPSAIPAFIQAHLESFFAVLILSALAIYLGLQNRRLRTRSHAKPEPDQTVQPDPVAEAVPLPVDPLLRAKYLMQQADFRGFYAELNRVLWKITEEKLNLPGSEMNKITIVKKLQEAGWDQQSTSLLENTFHECEMKLYTPAHDVAQIERILQDTEKILAKLGTT
jgi:BatD DUF11 like domain